MSSPTSTNPMKNKIIFFSILIVYAFFIFPRRYLYKATSAYPITIRLQIVRPHPGTSTNILLTCAIVFVVLSKSNTGVNSGINNLFVMYPEINANTETIAKYIRLALLPIILVIVRSSGMFVPAPAIRYMIDTPGAAPLATRAAINGIWPTAQTYIRAATTAIPIREITPG